MKPPTTLAGPTLLSDPVVAGIPLVEDGSAVVDLASVGVRVRPEPPAPPLDLGLWWSVAQPAAGSHRLVRRTLAERLAESDSLLPDGLHLLVVEGLRPLVLQRMIHAAYRARLATERPGLAPSALDRLASRFVAPPGTAPHVSAAAVDVTLVDDEGHPMDLGTPVDATPEASDGACYLDAPGIGAEARLLRTILAGALCRSGLVNYPTEWWHWSFGDRYWAHVTGSPFAIHGPPGRTALTPGNPDERRDADERRTGGAQPPSSARRSATMRSTMSSGTG
jgi:D-alanyl-D-alanine dipeptidase